MKEFADFAHQLADAAGAVIRPYFGAHGSVEAKSDSSPVTIADRAAEQAMRALIAARFPTHGIFGEEFGQSPSARSECVALYGASRVAEGVSDANGVIPPSKNYTWVLDPIDGTRAFIAGKKEWGTLISLCENGIPMLGILDQPVSGERWIGIAGEPTRYFSSPSEAMECSARPCASLHLAALSSTSKNHFTSPQAAQFVKLAQHCGEVVEDGDCYAYGLLARGARDLVVDAGLKPYDILALVPIVEGAGGVISGWKGEKLTLSQCDKVIASGSIFCHTAAIDYLR